MSLEKIKGHAVVIAPPAAGALEFHRMTASEPLGGPFEFLVDVAGSGPPIEPRDLLGQNVTVSLTDGAAPIRFFNGYVGAFATLGADVPQARYRMTLVPSLWFLTRSRDCRMFQEKTVPEIVRDVLRDHEFDDVETRLSADYPAREVTVQNGETDFQFVSRLLEHEGIFYFFRHEASRHVLVMADGNRTLDTVAGFERIVFDPERRGAAGNRLSEWSTTAEIRPGAVTLRDFDWKRPNADLEVRHSRPLGHALADGEIYEYPGHYADKTRGNDLARVHLEELQADFERYEGRGTAVGLAPGFLFSLTRHPRRELNRRYLVVHAKLELEAAPAEGGDPGERPLRAATSLTAIDARGMFRPTRSTPRPFVHGPQTAVVVGPAGEEICTDEHGRVKVRFHWDRRAGGHETDSGWIRVSQPWAGQGFGAVFIPRVGDEVVVSFLEGDPDRPLITGRVHNAMNPPPFALPESKAISGVKSRSTPGGGGYNEIVLDDTAGAERVRIQARHDMETAVGHDLRQNVGNDLSEAVGGDIELSVGASMTETVGAARTTTVGADETVTVGNNRSETVGRTMTLSVGKDLTETVAGRRTETVIKGYVLEAAKVEINAQDEIVLTTGKASITMKKNGDITIAGRDITIKGSGNLKLKGKNTG
jgi:type VI secretion system secreted protein VgrG